MSQQPAPPGQPAPAVIPYVEHHTGPRRVLVLYLTSGNDTLKGKTPPTVGIDGRRYVVYWGTVQFEIPADRPVHLSVFVESDYLTQAASSLLPPGQHPVVLTYETNYLSGQGRLS